MRCQLNLVYIVYIEFLIYPFYKVKINKKLKTAYLKMFLVFKIFKNNLY